MMEVLLDRTGDASVPNGYLLIEDEVLFLRHAPSGKAMLIRGSRLCDWAETYYRGRAVTLRPAVSPVQTLRTLCPALSETQALKLVERLQWTSGSPPEGTTLPEILTSLYPCNLWHGEPNVQHAAEWLLWLWMTQPDEEVWPLLKLVAEHWRTQIAGPIAQVYEVSSSTEALRLLDIWLSIATDAANEFGLFPLPIPPELMAHAREAWRKEITKTQGKFFAHLCTQPLPRALLTLAAQETAAYFTTQSQHLMEADLQRLAPYLSVSGEQALRRWLIPPQPSAMPTEIEELCHWFEDEYLPFRLWQHKYGDAQSAEAIYTLGREFADWYLVHYPQALAGGPLRDHLSFRQSLTLKDLHGVTLVVILDGLQLGDARRLEERLLNTTDRLTPLQRRLVFTPIPTVTELTKEALLRGVQPSRISTVAPLGDVIPDMADPVIYLSRAKAGGLYFWRVRDPDYTYHNRNLSATLHQDIEAAINNIAAKLVEIAENVPAEYPLNLVLTTDHGRLLSSSQRTKPVPPGMQSHGRAAWGCGQPRAYPGSGYVIENDIVYLHHERFGLPEDASIVLTEDAFHTNDGRGGLEHYAHGGLFPEEVIVSWMILARDWTKPEVSMRVFGDGVAHAQGELHIELVNYSDQPLHAAHLAVMIADCTHSLVLGEEIEPRGTLALQRPFTPWPKPAECSAAQVELTVRLASGREFTLSGEITLQSQEMYSRPNILEGLDL